MGRWGGDYFQWRPYVSVAQRRAKAERKLAQLRKKGRKISPVTLAGRAIAKTFWGKAWCDNLERYSDFANRLPRGRTYVRNGSVVDLQIAPGKVTALVSGSQLYTVEVGIRAVDRPQWRKVCKDCSGGIDSLVELLQGRLSRGVMEIITREGTGLFPQPREISLKCSCPDWATMCKHVAATLYGVGARLDERPELLFLLRGVDHLELIGGAAAPPLAASKAASDRVLAGADLSGLFGIELEEGRRAPPMPPRLRGKPAAATAKKKQTAKRKPPARRARRAG
jgi:uncharacterized Zn finger protein